MRTMSLFRITIVLPLLFAIGFALFAEFQQSERNRAVSSFHHCIDQGVAASIARLEKALGTASSKRVVAAKTLSSDTLVFDGDARCAQVLVNYRESVPGSADGYMLYTFGRDRRCVVCAGPPGTRIKSLKFNDDELLVELYGDLRLGSYGFIIPKSQCETFAVPWPKDAPVPNSPDLCEPIENRHRNAFVRVTR